MRIAALETVPFALPFRETYRTAAGSLDRRESLLVRLRSDHDGIEGIGEAVPLSLRGGTALAQVRNQIETVAGQLVGAEIPPDPIEANTAVARLLDRSRACGVGRTALCGIDLALHDLAGKACGLDVATLIGATDTGPITCNGTIAATEPEAAGVRAGALVEAGFSSIKVKVGDDAESARIDAVRSACEGRAVIRIDANGAWTPRRAIAKDLEMGPLELLEQPCRELEDMATVRSALATPIVADESIASPTQAELAIGAAACNATTIKLSKVGGIREAQRIAEVLPAYLSSALDGPLGLAAAAHCAAALPRVGYAHGLATASLFAATPGEWPEIVDGAVQIPPGPGFGIAIEEDALEELTIR